MRRAETARVVRLYRNASGYTRARPSCDRRLPVRWVYSVRRRPVATIYSIFPDRRLLSRFQTARGPTVVFAPDEIYRFTAYIKFHYYYNNQTYWARCIGPVLPRRSLTKKKSRNLLKLRNTYRRGTRNDTIIIVRQ